MAPRKRSSVPNVGAWLGGNRGYLQSGSNTDTSAKVDAGGGEMEQVRSELGLGAYTAGIGATAAIGAGVAAVRSGTAARVANKLTGKTVIVHSSPTKGLKVIEPRVAAARPEMGAQVYGIRPSNIPGSSYDASDIGRVGRHYIAERSEQIAANLGKTVDRFEGSMYVVKVPTKTLQGQGAYVTSPISGKVVKEIPVSISKPYKFDPNPKDIKKLEDSFRRAGGVPLKAPKEPKVPKKKRSSGPTRS